MLSGKQQTVLRKRIAHVMRTQFGDRGPIFATLMTAAVVSLVVHFEMAWTGLKISNDVPDVDLDAKTLHASLPGVCEECRPPRARPDPE